MRNQNEITSADDLNEQGRKSDVLVAALEKCEKLEQSLRIIVKILARECPDYQDWLEVHYKEYLEKWEKWIGKQQLLYARW